MKEYEKNASKSIKDTILNWMKKSPDVINTPMSEKGGKGWTPQASKNMNNADEAGVRWKESLDGPAGSEQTRIAKQTMEAERMRANTANESYKRKMLNEAKDKTTSAGMGRRLKAESDDFYNSDAGKNTSDYVTMKGDIAKNPDKKKGSGFGVSIDDGSKTMTPKQLSDFISQHAAGNYGAKLDDFNNGLRVDKPSKPQSMWEEHPNQKEHHTKMAMEGRANEIGDHVPNKKQYLAMQEDYAKPKDYVSQYKKGEFKTNFSTQKSGMSDIEKVALGGMAGATAGEVINAGMDLNAAKNRRDAEIRNQHDAHTYWSRKKNGQ